jgi:hypothetical protein
VHPVASVLCLLSRLVLQSIRSVQEVEKDAARKPRKLWTQIPGLKRLSPFSSWRRRSRIGDRTKTVPCATSDLAANP